MPRLRNIFIYTDLLFYLFVSAAVFAFYGEILFLEAIGVVLIFTGFIVWFCGRSQMSDSFQIKAEAKNLVTKGIYSKIRHPIYYGGLMVILGWVIYTIGDFISLVFVAWGIVNFALLIPRVINEEKILSKRFKSKYIKYKKETWF